MQLELNDVNYDKIRNALGDIGLGIEEVKDARGSILACTVWTQANYDNSGEIGGFPCGQITRQHGSFPRYNLMLDDGRLTGEKLIKVANHILGAVCR